MSILWEGNGIVIFSLDKPVSVYKTINFPNHFIEYYVKDGLLVLKVKHNIHVLFEYVVYVIIKSLYLCFNDHFILPVLLEKVFFGGFFSLYLRCNKTWDYLE